MYILFYVYLYDILNFLCPTLESRFTRRFPFTFFFKVTLLSFTDLYGNIAVNIKLTK